MVQELATVLARPAVGRLGDEAIGALADAYRGWAHAHPGRYQSTVAWQRRTRPRSPRARPHARLRNMSDLARRVGTSREFLCKAFSDKAEPRPNPRTAIALFTPTR